MYEKKTTENYANGRKDILVVHLSNRKFDLSTRSLTFINNQIIVIVKFMMAETQIYEEAIA